jgi:hypothetical protein
LTSRLALKAHFRKLKDPRRRHGQQHCFLDIIAIAICAVIAGADTWQESEAFGRRRHAWLKRFLTLPNGVPAHDTFERVFSRLDPAFQAARGAAARQLRTASMPRTAELTARQRAISLRLAGPPVKQICSALGRCEAWFHQWWRRYLESGPGGLYDRTRANHHVAQQIPPELERAILSIRRRLLAHATRSSRPGTRSASTARRPGP